MVLKPRQPFVGLALSAIGGIVAADWTAAHAGALLPWALGIAVGALLLAFWLARRDNARPCPEPRFGASRTTATATWLGVAALFFALHAFWQSAGPSRRLAVNIPAQGCVVRAIGVVNEEPAPDTRFRVRLESLAFGAKGELMPTPAEVLVSWTGTPPAYGDRVELVGDIHNLTGQRNRGEFDNASLQRRQGIQTEIRVRYARDARVLEHDCGRPFFAASYRLRHWMERTMALDLEDAPELAALIQSMVLGSRGQSLTELKPLFQYTGTLHLFAVSGLNVAMLAAVAAWVLRGLGVSRQHGALVIIPLLWVYCFATGLGASSIRATVMASVFFAGIAIDRPAVAWNTLGAAAFALLAWDPNQLFTPGFQLSFLMVAILMFTGPPLQAWLKPLSSPDPFLPRVLWSRTLIAQCWLKREMLGAVAVSLTAWLGSMPLMVFYFHLWSPSTVPANLIAVPIAWVMLILGLGSVLAGSVSSWLSIAFNNSNWLVAKALLAAISTIAAIPGAHVFVATPTTFARAPVCELEVLDVRGGGALFIRARGNGVHDWLLDCGSNAAFSQTVSPFLRSRGVNQLDGLIISHGDSRHIGSALATLKELAPTEVIESPFRDRSPSRRQLQETLAATGQGKAILWAGDSITLAPGVRFHVLYPPAPPELHVGPSDDKALVLRLDIDAPPKGKAHPTRVLFTSDGGFLTERWLLEHVPAEALRCDILVKGIHAKDLSGTAEFLKAVNPTVVVTSGASFPAEERVNESWAAQFTADQPIRLMRQDRTGAVRILVDDQGKWTAEPFLKD